MKQLQEVTNMTFNISNEDTSIMRLIFDVHQELSRMHLIHILIALQISILMIIFAFICIMEAKRDALDEIGRASCRERV